MLFSNQYNVNILSEIDEDSHKINNKNDQNNTINEFQFLNSSEEYLNFSQIQFQDLYVQQEKQMD